MADTDIAKAGMSGDLIRGASQIAVVKVLSAFIGLASTIILARLLVPDDFGLIAIAMSLIAIITALSDMSLSNALVQLEELEDEHYDTAFTLGFIRALLTALIIALLAAPIASFYNDERLYKIMLTFAAGALVTGFENPKMSLFIRRLNFRPSLIATLSERFGGFVIAAVTAYIFRSYWALVFSFIGGQFLRFAVGYFFIRYRPKFSLSKISDILGFSIWMTLGSWAQTFNWRSEPLILGYFVPMASLGYYGMAGRVTKMATTEITAPVGQVLFPAFSRMQDEPDRMRAAYKKALSSLTAIAFPTAIGLAVLAEPVTRFVLSEKWLPIIPLLQLMCVISLFKTMEKVVPIAMATGNTRALFGRDLRTLFIRMPLLLAGIFLGQHLGWGILIGALLGRGTAAMINTIWNMQLIAKITPITIVDHLKAFWRPLLASAIMAIAVHNLRYLPLFDSLHIASRIFIWSSAGALIYALVLGITWVLCKRPDGLENTLLELTKSLPARFAARRSSLTDEGK